MIFSIPAEPYDFSFDPAATALLIIDMQRDFVDSGGFGELLGNDVAPLREVIAPIGRVLAAWRAGCWRFTPARAIAPTCRIARRPSWRSASATRGRWGAC